MTTKILIFQCHMKKYGRTLPLERRENDVFLYFFDYTIGWINLYQWKLSQT